jgi:hypothetical protein
MLGLTSAVCCNASVLEVDDVEECRAISKNIRSRARGSHERARDDSHLLTMIEAITKLASALTQLVLAGKGLPFNELKQP